MVSLRSALLLLATPPTAFAWHIIFYPPPSPPPVSPAIAWYCPAFLTTVWALYPGGAEIEYHTIPFLPNGYMDVRLQSGMRFSRIWDASVATDVQVWNDDLGAGTVRLGPSCLTADTNTIPFTTSQPPSPLPQQSQTSPPKDDGDSEYGGGVMVEPASGGGGGEGGKNHALWL